MKCAQFAVCLEKEQLFAVSSPLSLDKKQGTLLLSSPYVRTKQKYGNHVPERIDEILTQNLVLTGPGNEKWINLIHVCSK